MKLSKIEKILLKYNPTKETWICNKCKFLNTGFNIKCFHCKEEKPEKPELVYPIYIEACRKVGIEPHSVRWQLSENNRQLVFPRNGHRWIPIEEFKEKGYQEPTKKKSTRRK